MIYIGVDPGVSGGIAIVTDRGAPANGVLEVEAFPMPATERDLLDALVYKTIPKQSRAVLERVAASPQMGVVSAFTFGKGYGGLRMALTAARIPFDEVTPATWQKALGCLSQGDKNITKRRAQQLFPQLTITHAIADALLIAEYCRRLDRGSLQPRPRRKGLNDGRSQVEIQRQEQAKGKITLPYGRWPAFTIDDAERLAEAVKARR